MNGMIKLSVIVTTYNGEKTIENTLRSILAQEGEGVDFELELIVVDDCSTDNTKNLLDKFPVIRFSTESNSGGPNKGRNIGLSHATGDYICIADHDDLWDSGRVRALIPYLQKVPIVTSGYTVVDSGKQKEVKRVKDDSREYSYYEKNKTFLDKLTKSLSGQNTYLGSIVFRKELKNIIFEEHFGVVDFDWVLRLFHNNDSIEVHESLYKRYVESTNLSLNQEYRRIDFYFSLMFIENYQKEFPAETKIAYRRIHGSRARYFYLIDDMANARFYFLRSGLSLKMLGYYVTTFWGAKFVKRKFNVFG